MYDEIGFLIKEHVANVSLDIKTYDTLKDE